VRKSAIISLFLSACVVANASIQEPFIQEPTHDSGHQLIWQQRRLPVNRLVPLVDPAAHLTSLSESQALALSVAVRGLASWALIDRSKLISPPLPVSAPPVKTSVPMAPEELRALVTLYFASEDVELALRVIWCESRYDPLADNPRSSASGLFQHLATYWDDRSAKAGWAGASIWDPEANIAVAAWLVYFGGGWGHWGPSRGCW